MREGLDEEKTGERMGEELRKRPLGHSQDGLLHQRHNLPFSPITTALAGLLIIVTTAYIAL